MNYQELEAKVLEWASDKGILEKATPLAQANKTLEEVGAKFNITRERVRQLEKKALEKLKAEFKDSYNDYIK